MSDSSSVTIQPYKHYHAILMKWGKSGKKEDIKRAFDEISAKLDTVTSPTCVVVDLRDNNFIPMANTARRAMTGPHRHPMIACWLVMGENRFAHYIADMLNMFTDEGKIKWFDDEAAVDDFLNEHEPKT